MWITKQNRIFTFLGVLCYLTAVFYLMEQFFPSYILLFTYSTIAAVLFAAAFFFISNVSRIVVSVLLIVGTICFYLEGVPLSIAMLGFGENTNLLSLFLLIPLIGTFMSTGGYLSALKEKVQEMEQKGGRHPYRLSYMLTASMGIILNYGSMAIVKRMAEESFTAYRDKRLSLNIMRAFGFCMLWSPYFVNVGLVLVLFDLSWFDIGLYVIILAVIYLVISYFLFAQIKFPEDPVVSNKGREKGKKLSQSLTPLYMFSITLIALSFLLDFLLPVNMLTVVSLLALVFPFIWAAASRLLRYYIYDVTEQVQNSFLKIKNELAVFISAGFFGMALSYTEAGTVISGWLFQASFGSVYLLSMFIVTVAIALAQIGIHPVIIIIGIGSSLSPEKFGVSPEYMAIVLLLAWTAATQMSPFSGQVLMTSRLMNQPPTAIIRQNYKFAILSAALLTTTLYFFRLAGWI